MRGDVEDSDLKTANGFDILLISDHSFSKRHSTKNARPRVGKKLLTSKNRLEDLPLLCLASCLIQEARFVFLCKIAAANLWVGWWLVNK